jgi:hypothetical protein
LAIALAVLVRAPPVFGQQAEFGHKVLGTLGLRAGYQQSPGIYVADKLFWYSSNDLIDRHGNSVPVGLDLDTVANAFGASVSYKVDALRTYVNAAISIPVASVSVNTTNPQASQDRAGLGDLYLQPLKLGWLFPQVDATAGYALYIPTATPGAHGGVGRGHYTNEFSLGGSVYFDRERTWQLSALASYELNSKKQHVDITRGDTVQIQGGVGKTLFGMLDVGLTAYALWQVRDDRGADLPDILRGGHDRAFGLGPEANVYVSQLRSRFTVRYAHDITVSSRVLAQILVFAISANVYEL